MRKLLNNKRKHICAFLFAALLAVLTLVFVSCNNQADGNDSNTAQTDAARDPGGFTVELGQGLMLNGAGKYTGMYMEDGSNEITENTVMVTVENGSDKTLEYAEISVTLSSGAAKFSVSTLPPGESAVLLEKNRLSWESGEKVISAELTSAVFFADEPTMCENQLEISAADGSITVKNISDSDIFGTVAVYYKNYYDGIYYGGITYRSALPDGIRAGETKTLTAVHYRKEGSRVVFADCAP